MIDNLILFVAQFVFIFLLGIQQLNVMRGYYVAAALTSLLLGICGWFTIGIIAEATTYDLTSVTFVTYIIAGPLGILSAMYFHSWMWKLSK
jgi:hypothetical protein